MRPSLGKRKTAAKICPLLIFSIGGRKLAAKTEDVDGISEWGQPIPVPSRTPFVGSVLRRDHTVLPVFDLAGLLQVRVRGRHRLCLTAKHPRGPLAICLDEEMPVLQTVDPNAVRPYQGGEFDAEGSVVNGSDEIPIISLTKLGGEELRWEESDVGRGMICRKY